MGDISYYGFPSTTKSNAIIIDSAQLKHDTYTYKGPLDPLAVGVSPPLLTISGEKNGRIFEQDLSVPIWNAPNSKKNIPIEMCSVSKDGKGGDGCLVIKDSHQITTNMAKLEENRPSWINAMGFRKFKLIPNVKITASGCYGPIDKCTKDKKVYGPFTEFKTANHTLNDPPKRIRVEYAHPDGWSWAKQITRCCKSGVSGDEKCKIADGSYIYKDHPKCKDILTNYCTSVQGYTDTDVCPKKVEVKDDKSNKDEDSDSDSEDNTKATDEKDAAKKTATTQQQGSAPGKKSEDDAAVTKDTGDAIEDEDETFFSKFTTTTWVIIGVVSFLLLIIIIFLIVKFAGGNKNSDSQYYA